jgi:toxin FitB
LIVVDTNVVSELSKLRPSPVVMAWLDAQPPHTLYLTSISAAKLWSGVAVMPDGARKRGLAAALDSAMDRLFAGRRLPFDDAAARAYAHIIQRTAAAGTPVHLADGLIAAVALSRGFAVASRDTAPFAAAGLQVIGPWADAAG